jgi:hypothetical protein
VIIDREKKIEDSEHVTLELLGEEEGPVKERKMNHWREGKI